MKEEIISKLFNGEELSIDELTFVGKNLSDPTSNTFSYDHEVKANCKEGLLKACGLTEEDFTHINRVLQEKVEDKKKEFKGISELVEALEDIALTSPRFLRMMMINYVKIMTLSQNPLGMILGMLGRG